MRCQNAHACRFLYFKYVLPAGPIATSKRKRRKKMNLEKERKERNLEKEKKGKKNLEKKKIKKTKGKKKKEKEEGKKRTAYSQLLLIQRILSY